MAQEDSSPGRLAIRLFGGFEVEVDGKPLRRLRSSRGLRMLAYLALAPEKPVDRAILAEAIWNGYENPEENLERTLHDLPRAIGDPPRRPIRLCSAGHNRIQLSLF